MGWEGCVWGVGGGELCSFVYLFIDASVAADNPVISTVRGLVLEILKSPVCSGKVGLILGGEKLNVP